MSLLIQKPLQYPSAGPYWVGTGIDVVAWRSSGDLCLLSYSQSFPDLADEQGGRLRHREGGFWVFVLGSGFGF